MVILPKVSIDYRYKKTNKLNLQEYL